MTTTTHNPLNDIMTQSEKSFLIEEWLYYGDDLLVIRDDFMSHFQDTMMPVHIKFIETLNNCPLCDEVFINFNNLPHLEMEDNVKEYEEFIVEHLEY